MADNNEYIQSLSNAINSRREWLENSELTKLKEELRTFQTAFSSLYHIYLKKGLIHEDPYKAEARVGEIEIPETGPFSEMERIEQLSIRLSNYDNQLDFLVNFYQFNTEFLTLERMKRILSLVKYIDWAHLNPDNQSPNTRAVVDITNQIKVGGDPLSSNLISKSLSSLSRTTGTISSYLKVLSDFNREVYKLELRTAVTGTMPPAEAAQIAHIKKKFAAALPGKAFYPDLVEEVIREDYSKEGPALQENILKLLQITENKPKTVKEQVSFKTTLIEGIHVIGSVGATLDEIGAKFDENEMLLENRKKRFWEKVKWLMQQVLNKEPEPIIYEVEYTDSTRGTTVREKVNFYNFREEITRKARGMTAVSVRGNALARLESMQDDQLVTFLAKSIRDIQSLHRTLSALDDFFKAAVDQEDREKVRGIKPELATIKNAIVKANQKRYDYTARKEEEEQLKRLGISSES
ncbi:MAG: hypothetical protein LBT95_04085 [Treponema sp.]|jgi:hypothetical protein|nr:hypothetical protein [Treponema sp.]